MHWEFGSAGAVCSIEDSSGPQNQRVQKVMSQGSTGSCTRANALPGLADCGQRSRRINGVI